MSKLQEIINGYSNLLLGRERELAESRAKICSECPKLVDNFCNKDLGGCGCWIPAKTSSTESKCPDEKW